ncbi:DUF4270 family protein [Hymenobacter arizonensis]|uniref:DUF4270 domain-containing protein n=1 Tax=Hymenobacter arizonensis TaxID=1227077 RepID=A0A1I5XGB3_HYMAR|nr:DUF4270 family protein [Hymenobacter arizonensis]SFQ30856.1 protein of unknown function [Hymenobacter arizonensis]
MNWLTSRCAPVVALSALALTGCDKGTDLNVDLPNTTAISTEYTEYKTPLLDVATVRTASVQSLKADHYLIGRLTDNVAGITEARSFLNVVAGSSNDSLPSKLVQPVLDSVVLVMGFDRVNGSSATPVRFDVSDLQAPLDERLPYNSATATAKGALLGQNLMSRLDRTALVVTDTSTRPVTRTAVPDQTIRLALQRSGAVAAPFAPAPAVASSYFSNFFATLRGSGASFTQAQLNRELKGLAIEPSQGYSSAIVSFGRSYNGRLAFFFHDAAAAAPVAPARRRWRSYSVFFGPIYSSGGAAPARDPRYYTQMSSNLANTDLSRLSDATQAVASATLNGTSYLQEGVGLSTRVTLRGLEALRNMPGLIINRAELRVPVKPFSNALFPNPRYIYAVEADNNNKVLQRILNFLPSDRVVQEDGSNQLVVGRRALGILEGPASQQYYTLVITNYLQAYLNDRLGGNPASLLLIPDSSNLIPDSTEPSTLTLGLNRAVIDAANVSLRVYYSKR